LRRGAFRNALVYCAFVRFVGEYPAVSFFAGNSYRLLVPFNLKGNDFPGIVAEKRDRRFVLGD